MANNLNDIGAVYTGEAEDMSPPLFESKKMDWRLTGVVFEFKCVNSLCGHRQRREGGTTGEIRDVVFTGLRSERE